MARRARAGRGVIAAVTGGHGPSALWYATRGTGAVTLLLLTASVVLGVGEQRAWRPVGTSRFAIAAMHQTLSLLAVAVLVVHIVTTLLDPFPHIGLLTALVPFATPYRPLWTGLGTVGSDLLLALVVTSLVRRRLGYRAWRGVHWLAYACWPVAVLHGLGTGSDTRATWMLALTAVCVAAVAVAVAARVVGSATPAGVRRGVIGAVALTTVGLVAWTMQGPLAHGWARRAGTPASVLQAFSPAPATAATAVAVPARRTPAAVARDALSRPFAAALAGALHRGTSAGGTAVVDLSLRLRAGPHGVLRIRLGGQALAGGGLHMTRSAVTLGPPRHPGRYSGRIGLLEGQRMVALLGSRDGGAIRLTIDLVLGTDTVAGRVRGEPVGSVHA